MRILLAHNFYQQTGGEDYVFYSEAALLEQHGHSPLRYVLHNNAIHTMAYLTVAGKALWNSQAHRELAELVRNQSIDVVHFHNTFPLISPAAYSAVRKQGAAVVQTLHNYRLLCPAATLYRDGHDCDDCINRTLKLPAVTHRCYRDSFAATGVLAGSLAYHHRRGTFSKDVDLYIAPSMRTRAKFIEAGFDKDQLVVKPHFVDRDPGAGPGGHYAIVVARLAHEKGLATLLEAWKQLRGHIPLKVVGDGPMRDALLEAIHDDTSIEWLGRRPLHETYELLRHAACCIIPSHTRETFGRVAIESLACGTPVIAANHGALADIVSDRTGRLVTPRDPKALATAVDALMSNPQALREMRMACRAEFEQQYTAERNYPRLISIYEQAIMHAHNHGAQDLGLEFEEHDFPLPHNQLG